VVGEGSATRLGWRRGVATGVIVVAIVSPALRDRDSFPLSTYPVYATARGSEVTLATAVGITATGDVRRLSLGVIARTDDPLIAESFVDRAIAAGRAGSVCAGIAARAPDDVVAVEVVDERHDISAQRNDSDTLLERTVHARCSVAR